MPSEKIVIKKKKIDPLSKLGYMLTGESDQLGQKARATLMLKEYKLAKSSLPEYEKLKRELLGFYVQLPQTIEVRNLSEINAAYALAQSYYSRCVTISMLAEDNYTRWKRVRLLITDYIEEKKADLLLENNIRTLKNSLQEAVTRSKLKKPFRFKNKVELYINDADSFRKIVENRKSDLEEVLTTLAKQVKALALERDLTHH